MKTLTLTIALILNSISAYTQNLISNPTFETAISQIYCSDWFDRCGNELTISCDTTIYCQVGFRMESPIPSQWEAWSLDLKPGWPSEGFAETYVTGQAGTNVYELKYWIKTPLAVTANYITGYGSIGTGTQSQFTPVITAADTAIQWKQITIIDTLTTGATDTITVRLAAENCDLCVGSVYFDYIELNIIANITSIDDQDLINKNIKVYPNPANATITIEIINNKYEEHRLLLFDGKGELIYNLQMNGNIFSIEKNNLAAGLYLYKVQRMRDKNLIGQGKIIIE